MSRDWSSFHCNISSGWLLLLLLSVLRKLWRKNDTKRTPKHKLSEKSIHGDTFCFSGISRVISVN